MNLISILLPTLLLPMGHFKQDLAWNHLQKQCAFGPRVPGTKAHADCRDYIVEEMKKSCENVRLQPFTHVWSQNKQELKLYNILGEQNWKDAKVRVVLLAHWDSRPYCDQDPDPANQKKPVLGANDGASGVAVLLELMRCLKGRLKDVGILYLMTDGEDLGPELDEMLLGAAYFAKNLPSPKPDYGILLDMVGDKNLRIPVEEYGYSFARDLVQQFYRHAKAVGLQETFPYVQGGWIVDDHKPLNEAGIPTMDLIDFTYPQWHTAKDTPEHCSADSLGKVGLMLESWLLKTPPYKFTKPYSP